MVFAAWFVRLGDLRPPSPGGPAAHEAPFWRVLPRQSRANPAGIRPLLDERHESRITACTAGSGAFRPPISSTCGGYLRVSRQSERGRAMVGSGCPFGLSGEGRADDVGGCVSCRSILGRTRSPPASTRASRDRAQSARWDRMTRSAGRAVFRRPRRCRGRRGTPSFPRVETGSVRSVRRLTRGTGIARRLSAAAGAAIGCTV